MSWNDIYEAAQRSNRKACLNTLARREIPEYASISKMLKEISWERHQLPNDDEEVDYLLELEQALVKVRSCCFELIKYRYDV